MAGQEEERQEKRILVLCIDRDDDIGQKIGLSGPIIGRKNNLKAAESLLLTDPEESDGNAIFGAVMLYDRLLRDGKNVEVATITGHREKGLKADDEISKQLRSILKEQGNIKGVIFVSDGADDEFILPIIQSIVPVLSIHRVIVQQSKEIETTFIIIMRYLQRYLSDPSFTRTFLGLPGIFFMAAAILYLLNQLQYLSAISLFLIGGTLLIKGFNLGKTISSIKRMLTGKIEFFTMVSGLLMSTLFLWIVYIDILNARSLSLPSLLAKTANAYLWIMFTGFVIWFLGGAVEGYIRKSGVFWERIFLIVTTVALYPIVLSALNMLAVGYSMEGLLNLLTFILVGMLVVTLTFLVAWKKRGKT